ncbi:MAG: CDP-glycerol glycerophosphotransferase family protein [Firmicutes bacterium]|nr:CDP-glycerol glycerophosphotransferase family protein [Bacillota bacterium]
MGFKISVICPVYNMEQYIMEAFESLERQTIGFDSNIQVIFVNDGSTDSSEGICLKLKDKHPDNVLYIKKENGGVSSARNMGLQYAEGKYVAFLDPDDKWECHAFERVNTFFENHGEEIDVCVCKLEHIGDYAGKEHALDFRFAKGNRVVNLSEEPEYVCSTIGNVFIKRDRIQGVRFNEELSTGEDSVFVNTVLLQKLKVGIISNAVFYYRRDFSLSSGSASGSRKISWYFDVPRLFYLGLYQESMKAYGRIVPYIQAVVLYDLRWRKYNSIMFNDFTDRDEQEYMSLLHEVVSQLDDKMIVNTIGLNQYRKLYLINMKNDYRLPEQLQISGNALVNKDGLRIFTFRARTFFSIETIEVEDDTVILHGVSVSKLLNYEIKLYVKDENGKKYNIQTNRYEKKDKKGFIGEIIAESNTFCARVPLQHMRKLSFFAEIDGVEVELNPGYGEDTGIERYSMSYILKGNYVIKYLSRKLCFYKDTRKIRITSKHNYKKSMLKQEGGKEIVEKHFADLKQKERIDKMKLQNRVAFVSGRCDNDVLLSNLLEVYERCKSKKIIFSRKLPISDQEFEKGIDVIYHSKVVVTDDYSFFLRRFGKKSGQIVVQLWHAAGAFKKFGQDGSELSLPVDRLYHKDYDLVSVSSPFLVDIYSHAFDVSREVVKPLGVPRTDFFYDDNQIKAIQNKIYETHPELVDKEIIVYAPTFRNHAGQKKVHFSPKLNFRELSDSLNEEQVVLICPHPVMQNEIIDDNYKNIFVMRDYSTNDYMLIADLLITDYSSVIFEYSLLGKPMAFFCYDYETYNRDFYLDYETDLPGPIFKNESELFDYLRKGSFEIDERMEQFKDKYMSACDGHCSERIAELIDNMCH